MISCAPQKLVQNFGEEIFSAIGLWIGEEGLFIGIFDYLSFIHKDHPVGHLTGEAISWVTTIIVIPSLASSTMTSSTSLIISGSSAEVAHQTA